MSLATLPPEVFSAIVANIESQPTLCHLAQCSRRLYLWTVPHLYRHIRIHEGKTEKVDLNKQLRNIASLLIRRSDLAGLVRCFTLQVAIVPPGPLTPLGVEGGAPHTPFLSMLFESSDESEDYECSEAFEEYEGSEAPEESGEPEESEDWEDFEVSDESEVSNESEVSEESEEPEENVSPETKIPFLSMMFESSDESEDYVCSEVLEEYEGSEALEESGQPEESEDWEDFEVSDESEDSEESEEPEEHVSPKIFEVDQAFKTAVDAWGFSKGEENELLRDLSNTHECHTDLILSLLLPVLHKLEKLVLHFELVDFDARYLERMMRRAAHRERPFDIHPSFEALTVVMRSHKDCDEQPVGFIASLLKLPAIQVISGGFSHPWNNDLGEDKDLSELESFSSPLTSLDLAAYTLDRADLGNVLQAPKALKDFFYTVCWPASIDFIEMRDALGPQQNCLERLGLDFDERYEYYYDLGTDTDFFGTMRSFISFKKLKVFQIAALFLEETDNGTEPDNLINIFPPNLETLHLTRFQNRFGSVLEALEHLLEQKSPQQIPSLNKLILEESESRRGQDKLTDILWKGTEENAIGRLSKVAADQGVSLDVIVST